MDKNLEKLKNIYRRIMKNPTVEILWSELLNLLYFYCFKYANSAKN